MKKIQLGDSFNSSKTCENIKRIRENYNETQATFAKKIGYTQSFVAKLENGQASMSIETAIKICSIYGLSLEQLIILNDDPFPEI